MRKVVTQSVVAKGRLGANIEGKVVEKAGEKFGQNPKISINELSQSIGISTTAIEKNLAALKDKGQLKYRACKRRILEMNRK